MEALLRFLFIVVLLYYGFKLVIRYVAPWLLSQFMKKQQDKFNQMNGFANSDYSKKKEGEIHIKTKPSKEDKEGNDFGEYIDFEDVDDK